MNHYVECNIRAIDLIKLSLENIHTVHAWLVEVDFKRSRVGTSIREKAYLKTVDEVHPGEVLIHIPK